MRISAAIFCVYFPLSLSALAEVTPESCLNIHRSVGVSMTDSMVKDFGIAPDVLILDKTVMTLIDKNKMTSQLAAHYARQTYLTEPTHFLPESELASIFAESDSTNIIVKYDYVNQYNQHNITLASLIVNDEECSVRFNGYIIVKREF